MNNIHSHNNHFFIYFEKKRSSRLNTQQLCFLTPHLDDTRHIVPSSPPFIIPPVFTQAFLFEFLFSPILFKCIFDSEYMVRLPETPHFFSFSLFLSQLLCNDVRLCDFRGKNVFRGVVFPSRRNLEKFKLPEIIQTASPF